MGKHESKEIILNVDIIEEIVKPKVLKVSTNWALGSYNLFRKFAPVLPPRELLI